MRPPVIKIPAPQGAKRAEIVKAVDAKLTRRVTDLFRRNEEVVLTIFAFERAAGSKKPRKR